MLKTAALTPRQHKTAIALCAVMLFYLLFGFFGAPFIIQGILEKKVAVAINRQVTVGQVRVNPLSLSVTLRNLDIRETGGNPFVKLDEAYVNLQASSLFKWALVLKSIRLINPNIVLVRTGEVTFNFSDIGADEAGADEDLADADSGPALAIYNTHITGGRISMDDRVVSVSHLIDDLDLLVTDLSSRPADMDVYTSFNLSASINGALFSLDGKTRPFSPEREVKAEIGLKSFHVPHYLPYASLPENLIVDSFTLEMETELDFRMLEGGNPELVVAGLFYAIDARLADANGDPFVYHPNLKLDLLPSKVLTGQLRLAEVEASGPEYFLKRLSSGELYLPFLAVKAIDAAEEKAAADATGKFQPVVTIDALHLKQGVVHFTDLSNREPFSTTITDLSLEMDNVGLNRDRTAAYRLTIKTEADESVAVAGTALLTPLEASGEISVADVNVSRYAPYYQDIFDFKTVEGRVAFGGNYRFRLHEEGPLLSLAGVHLDVDTLKVVDQDDDEPLISLDKLQLTDTTADLANREVTLGKLVISQAHLLCRREKDGSLNLVKAFVPGGRMAGDAVAAGGNEIQSEEPASTPMVIVLKDVEISDVAVDVEDRVPTDPVRVRVDHVALKASDLSTAPGSTGKTDFSLRWEQGGKLTVGGDVTLSPFSLDVAVKMKAMDIRPFQPYLSEQAGLIVTQGFIDTRGRLQIASKEGAPPAITYGGKAGLNRFASIDRKHSNDFLKWEALSLETLEVGVNPTRLSIEQVALADFFARVIVDADGGVNLVSMFKQPEAAATVATEGAATVPEEKVVPPSSGDKPTIRIARVMLKNGVVDFSDRLIKPNFNATFHDFGGRVSGLASMAEERADVLLEGMWSNHAPVKITGLINPLIDNPYVDLNLNISDIELSPFSPYSGKYIGYILEKGKLTFNVAYLMENRKLEGKNSIYVNQLTLGDRVESDDAVNLPIKMAVALLKDREGNIKLDLPVSGSLDDPEFKIGRVILTVIKNLIVKIVTSPFAALGALAGGGGEELSYLDFSAGVSDISGKNAEKMDKLATILYERPALNLDIQGTIAPRGDMGGLQAILLEDRLKAQKLQKMMKAGKSAVPLEEIVLSAEERVDILEAVFETSGIPAPVDDNDKPVELTPAIMEQLLRDHTEVTDNDYRSLANARAFNAKNYLLETGQVERERAFIVAPQTGSQVEGSDRGRVVFSLK